VRQCKNQAQNLVPSFPLHRNLSFGLEYNTASKELVDWFIYRPRCVINLQSLLGRQLELDLPCSQFHETSLKLLLIFPEKRHSKLTLQYPLQCRPTTFIPGVFKVPKAGR